MTEESKGVKQANPWLVLALSVLLAGCPPPASPAPTNGLLAVTSTQPVGPTPPSQVAPPPAAPLPEFYGSYIRHSGSLIDLSKAGAPINVTPGLSIIVFDKAVALLNPSGYQLHPMYDIRFRVSGVAKDPTVADLPALTLTIVKDTVRSGPPISFRARPVPNQAEMVELIPSEPIVTSAQYSLTLGGAEVVRLVVPGDEAAITWDEGFDLYDDRPRPTSALDSVVAALRGAISVAQGSLEDPTKPADEVAIRQLLAICERCTVCDPTLGPHAKRLKGALSLKEARRLEAEGRLGPALREFAMALQLDPDSGPSRAGVARLKPVAVRDPSGFVISDKTMHPLYGEQGFYSNKLEHRLNGEGTLAAFVNRGQYRQFVSVYDATTGKFIWARRFEGRTVKLVGFLKSPERLVLGLSANRVSICDPRTGEEISHVVDDLPFGKWKLLGDRIYYYSPHAYILKTLENMEVVSGAPPEGDLWPSVACMAEGRGELVVCTSRQGVVEVISLRTKQAIKGLKSEGDLRCIPTLNVSGTRVARLLDTGRLIVDGLHNGGRVIDTPCDASEIRFAEDVLLVRSKDRSEWKACSEGEQRMLESAPVVPGTDGRVVCWRERFLDLDPGGDLVCAVSPKGDYVCLIEPSPTGTTSSIRTWSAANSGPENRGAAEMPFRAHAAVFSPDGTELWVCADNAGHGGPAVHVLKSVDVH